MIKSPKFYRDFFLDKKREKAKLEAEMKLQVTLRVIVPAGEAKAVSQLNIIGGQYYLNMPEFVKDFNQVSLNKWQCGIPIPIIVQKGLRAKEYSLFLKPPLLNFILDVAAGSVTRKIYYLDLWAVVQMKKKDLCYSEHATAKVVFSHLYYSVFFDEDLAEMDQLQFEEDLKALENESQQQEDNN